MRIRGVIFDLDGVLVSTDELHYRAWSRLASEEGVAFTREDNHRQRGVSRMESLKVLLEKASGTYTEAQKNDLAERKNGYYRSLLSSLTPHDVLPGSLELVRSLRASGVRVAVASASRNAPLIMKNTGLAAEVDAVADGNEITRSKPDPEVFLLAAAKIGIPPAECLVVEDAVAGIEAGRRAGMAVFAIGPADRHPGVERRADSLHGISSSDLIA